MISSAVGLERARDLGCGDDRAGRAVADAAAVVQAQRRGDGHRLQHVFFGDRVAQVRLRVVLRVRVALHRDVGHRALQVGHRHAVLGGIGRGQLRERAGRGGVGQPQVVGDAARAHRQAAVAGVLQLLDAEREHDVVGARGHGVGGATQRLGAGGAGVLDARGGDARQAQCTGQRAGGLADVVLFEADAEPRGLDLLEADAGVEQSLVEGFEHQLVGAAVPALAEARATHAEDGDLVADAAGHSLSPRVGSLARTWVRVGERAGVRVGVGVIRARALPSRNSGGIRAACRSP